MVKIIADNLFEEELDKYLDDAYEQYGQKCVDHWQKGYEGIIKRTLGQMFADGFFQIPTHDGHPCLWLGNSCY